MRNFIGRVLIAMLVLSSSAAFAGAEDRWLATPYSQRHELSQGLGDLIQQVVTAVHNAKVERDAQELRDLSSSIKKELSKRGASAGALVRIDVYVAENGQMSIRGPSFLGVGTNPDQVLADTTFNPDWSSIGAGPPDGAWQFDADSSGYGWVTLGTNGKLNVSTTVGVFAQAMKARAQKLAEARAGARPNSIGALTGPRARSTFFSDQTQLRDGAESDSPRRKQALQNRETQANEREAVQRRQAHDYQKSEERRGQGGHPIEREGAGSHDSKAKSSKDSNEKSQSETPQKEDDSDVDMCPGGGPSGDPGGGGGETKVDGHLG